MNAGAGEKRGRFSPLMAVNRGAAFLVSRFFLTLVDAIGRPAAFWLFAFFCAAGWVWISRQGPETKGRPLGQINRFRRERERLAPLIGRIGC